jgi:Ni,Fe-hydrogenase III large subunit
MIAPARADIAIALELVCGRVSDVGIVPRRLPPLDAMLAGRPVADMLALLPRLFALCASAHSVAAQTAVDAARGIDSSPAQQRRRSAALVAERLAEQLRGAVTASRLLERPHVANATRQVIRAASWFALEASRDVPEQFNAIEQIETALDRIGIGDLELPKNNARFGSSGTLALTAENDRDIIARLMEGGAGYAAAPDLSGAVPETGPWARSRAATSPDTPEARLRARLCELAAMAQTLHGLVTRDQPPGPHTQVGYRLGDNLGAAAVETARGRLYHLVELDRNGRVARFHCLAPTEWNFHPRGPLARMLRGATLPAEGQQPVEQLIAAFDPCVDYQLSIREVADA